MDAATWANIGTAAGTLALAAATFRLARRTSEQVASSREQASSSERQAEASRRQAEAAARQAELLAGQLATAQESLRAATRPLLADVPRDEDDSATQINANIEFEHEEEVNVRVPVRNVGAGPAVIVHARLAATEQAMEAQQWAPGSSAQNIVAPGERVPLRFIAPPGSAAYSTLHEQVLGCLRLIVEIQYRDLVEDHDATLRLGLACNRSNQEWRVTNSEVVFSVGRSLSMTAGAIDEGTYR